MGAAAQSRTSKKILDVQFGQPHFSDTIAKTLIIKDCFVSIASQRFSDERAVRARTLRTCRTRVAKVVDSSGFFQSGSCAWLERLHEDCGVDASASWRWRSAHGLRPESRFAFLCVMDLKFKSRLD